MIKFSENIRSLIDDDLSELEASIREFGFLPEFPVIQDEDGNTIVGHRRLKAAQAVNVEPAVIKLSFGSGDEADVKRFRLALASNLGTKLMTKEDRQRIAQHLYGDKQWTMQRIAEALNVGTKTISRDLDSFVTVTKPSRPKGGRPKKLKAHKKEPEIAAAMDKGLTQSQIARATGMGQRAVRHVVERVKAYREGQADPPVDVSTFSETVKQKFDRALRQHQSRLDASFENRVLAEIKKRIDEMILPHWKKQIEQAHKLYKHRRGAMDKATFNKIRRALHPDSRHSISDRVLGDAFDTFMQLEKFLLDEASSPTEIGPLPANLAEWDKMKAAATAQRQKQKHGVTRR